MHCVSTLACRHNIMKKKTANVTLIAGTCINLSIGVIYAWSVIKKAMVADWGWTNAQANSAYTVGIVVWASNLRTAEGRCLKKR